MTVTRLLRTARALQQPKWNSLDKLNEVLLDLETRAPLVTASSVRNLREELACAVRGRAFVVQAGDCAERFVDATPERTREKATFLRGLADIVTAESGIRSIVIGRMGGQYAKPRSNPTEVLPDGMIVPVYRGDAVNGPDAVPEARIADPRRLRQAYQHAKTVIDSLQHYGDPVVDGPAVSPVYVSHEALLLEYEQALTRGEVLGEFGSSAHLLWVGERTRQIDHAHIDFLASISNPIGVKIGPDITGDEARELVRVLNPNKEPGRLTFIVRMGAAAVAGRLPPVLAALGSDAADVLWMSDPMHGNTTTNGAGQKTRVLEAVVSEVESVFEALSARGLPMGGLHLEATHDPVRECASDTAEFRSTAPLPNYETACDPRLNAPQASTVVSHVGRLMA